MKCHICNETIHLSEQVDYIAKWPAHHVCVVDQIADEERVRGLKRHEHIKHALKGTEIMQPVPKQKITDEDCFYCNKPVFVGEEVTANQDTVVHQACFFNRSTLKSRTAHEEKDRVIQDLDNNPPPFDREWEDSLKKAEVAFTKPLVESMREFAGEEYMRTFSSGATRDTDEGKLDYEAFLSPLVLKRYAEHLHKHRIQSDGKLRDGDNWQKGIAQDVYMKSMWRHFFAVWEQHRGIPTEEGREESLCALIFNASGMLHEFLKVPALTSGNEEEEE